MSTQTTTTNEAFVEQALAAWNAEQAASADRQKQTDTGDLMRIWEKLEAFGIVPNKTQTIRNRNDYGGYTSELLVPITASVDTRAWTDDNGPEGYYQPAVAATIRNGEVWIVAEYSPEDDGPTPGHYLPVGPLTGLDVIGRALDEGGRFVWTPPTVVEQVQKHLTSVSGDRIDSNGAVFLSGCEAVCAALLDIAAAIREGRDS